MKLKVIFFCFTVLTISTAIIGLFFYFNTQKAAGLNKDRTISISHSNAINNSLSQLVSRYQNITLSLSRHPELNLLLTQPSSENLNHVDQLLDIYNSSLKTSVCYLLNRDGVTIASSNRNKKDSFVGKNYSFRPYFKNAVQGKPFVHLALGITSGIRGIYFSNSVHDDNGGLTGVVVLKEDVAKFEDELLAKNYPTHLGKEDYVFIINENGVIFISDRHDLLYHTMWKVEPADIEKIESSKQFGKGPWPWAGFKRTGPETVVDRSGRSYHLILNDIDNLPGWKIVHLSDSDAISERVFSSLFETAGYIFIFIFTVIGLVLLILNFLAADAEKSLRSSEERYRSVTETIDEGIILQAASGEILTWNRGAEKIFGIPAEVAIGRTSESNNWSLIHKDGSKYEGQDHPSMRTLRTGEACRNEIMGVYQPSGELRWISVNTNPIFKGREDKPYAVAISFSDVTEMELNRKELQESRAMLQAAMDYSQAGIAIASAPDGKLKYVNDSALRIRGKSEEEVVNGVGIDRYVASWKILHLDGTPYKEDEVPLARAILYGETCTKEFIVQRSNKEDRVVWANAAPIKNDKGEIAYGIVVFLDITERKIAQEALEKSEERLKLALDSVSDAVWDWRVDTGEVYFSSRWYTMLGYDPYELPQEFETWRNLLHPDDLPESEKIVFSHLEMAEPFKTEFRMRTKDNQWRWILARGKTVETDGQGKALRMLGTHMDITERKKMEERIQHSQKIESIGSLAGGIAHDFNNILFPVVGLAELLLEDLPSGSPEYENANQILKAGRRGSDLVKQILTFSRQSEQKKIPIRAQSVLKEVLKLSRSTIPTDIDIIQDIQSDCGLIMADPTQIHQVAMNLITNAYHAVEEANGGKISVRLKETEIDASDSSDSILESGRYLLLSVSDTGHGIPTDVINKIFDPYFTTKEQGKGTGLGLAVVHGIIQDHRGAIKVSSEIGQGSTFDIYIPLMEKADTSEPIEAGEIHPVGNERILLVDDEESIAKLEMQMLERLGYKVTVRNSSPDALKTFKSTPDSFDLVITDMTMPNMTGDQLAKEMRSIRFKVPIIICTGFSERINQEKAKAFGIKGFLMKPVVKLELAKMVRKVLDENKDET